MSLRPVEWVFLHPLSSSPIALIRLVHLGLAREPYYRAVTADSDPTTRELLGYWSTLELAEQAVHAIWEQREGRGLEGGDQPPCGITVPAMKPPPGPPSGPAVPKVHASRR